MSSPPFDQVEAQRWFAVECNNAAWELVEAASRSAAETDRMLHLAHAACCHWQAVGTAVNQQRAFVLLAFAHALGGSAGISLKYAKGALGIDGSESTPLTTFDRCAAAAAMRVALKRTGHMRNATQWLDKVQLLIPSLDANEQAVLRRLMKLAIDGRH